jgi:apolipoprotein D and lipocalin family protein
VIQLEPDYAFAVVGHPSRDYLWILSRTPTLEPEAYEGVLKRLEAQGYELSRLVKTAQPSQ